MKATETLNLISKQWADINDVMKLANVGRSKAVKIKSEIRDEYIRNNNYLPNVRLIPMSELVKKLNINVNYLKRVEKE